MSRSPANPPSPALDPAALPQHVAIIMDGNGRWAKARHRPRLMGHRAGAKTVRTVVTECATLGIGALTLYSFSSENWKRPRDEVGGLMRLMLDYLERERAELIERGIRFRQIGRRDRLPAEMVAAIERTEAATAGGDGMDLLVALDYGSRDEITEAARALAEKAARGELDPADITAEMVSEHLYTAGIPDPDLLIRTAGEFRLSNYLLWQISYAELHVSEQCWPAFTVDDLRSAFADFARRQRRFGGLPGAESVASSGASPGAKSKANSGARSTPA